VLSLIPKRKGRRQHQQRVDDDYECGERFQEALHQIEGRNTLATALCAIAAVFGANSGSCAKKSAPRETFGRRSVLQN
jgi:hypothetical protein